MILKGKTCLTKCGARRIVSCPGLCPGTNGVFLGFSREITRSCHEDTSLGTCTAKSCWDSVSTQGLPSMTRCLPGMLRHPCLIWLGWNQSNLKYLIILTEIIHTIARTHDSHLLKKQSRETHGSSKILMTHDQHHDSVVGKSSKVRIKGQSSGFYRFLRRC